MPSREFKGKLRVNKKGDKKYYSVQVPPYVVESLRLEKNVRVKIIKEQ